MEKQQLEKTGSTYTKAEIVIIPTESVADRRGGGTNLQYIEYWEQVYATTQSAALKQKAAVILGIKEKK